MKDIITPMVRVIFSLILIYFAYRETGIATAIIFFFLTVAIELHALLIIKILRRLGNE